MHFTIKLVDGLGKHVVTLAADEKLEMQVPSACIKVSGLISIAEVPWRGTHAAPSCIIRGSKLYVQRLRLRGEYGLRR